MKKKIIFSVFLGIFIMSIAGCSKQEKTDTDGSEFSEEIEEKNTKSQMNIDLEQYLGNKIETVKQEIELSPFTQIGVDYTADNGLVEIQIGSDDTITDIYVESESTYSFSGIKCGMYLGEIEEILSQKDSYQYSVDVTGDEVAFWKKGDINLGGFFYLDGKNNCDGMIITTDFSGLYQLYKEDQPYILFESVYRNLTDEDVEGFAKEKLSEAIDEIYAREGMEFASIEKKAKYADCLWYKPVISEAEFSDDMLTDVEKYNIQFLESQIEDIDNKEIEKKKIVERGYEEETYKNPDGYTIVMEKQEDVNFEKIDNIFNVKIYNPDGEILCEEIGMELDTNRAVLDGYECEIEQLSDGKLSLLLSYGLMYQVGQEPYSDEGIIKEFSKVN